MINEKPCLLCRLIGHKWIDKSKKEAKYFKHTKLIFFDSCIRCGKPFPFRDNDLGSLAQVHKESNK